jgi:hypothetical protein
MKKILLSLSVALIASIAIYAQSVSINTDGSSADASSILDVKSTTKGMLIPRMTTAQRTAITAPANGLLIYDTDVKSFWYYNGTLWTNLVGNSGLTLPFSKIVVAPDVPALELTNTGPNGPAIKGTAYGSHGILGVTHSDNAHAGIRGDATGEGSAGVRGSSGNSTGVGVDAVNIAGGLALNVNGNLKIAGGNTNPGNGAVLTSDALGNATWKASRIGFRARGSGQISPMDYILLSTNTEEYDYSNSFNAASGEFTAPVSGLYSFGTTIRYELDDDWDDNIEYAEIQVVVFRGGTLVSNNSIISPYGTISNNTFSSSTRIAAHGDVRLLAGDVVRLRGFQRNGAGANTSWTGSFYGHIAFAD